MAERGKYHIHAFEALRGKGRKSHAKAQRRKGKRKNPESPQEIQKEPQMDQPSREARAGKL
jgi:hypothetical protein